MTLTTEARFAGLWTVSREIEDLAGGPPGRFRGLGRIAPDGEGLRYAEHGRLTVGAARMQASRVYLWRPEGPTRVRVLYEDGRPFHVFDWSRVESADAHLCGEDRYEVAYSFSAESWRVRWRVTGPAKDYVSKTLYIRRGEG
jgi:hypothetical protein